MIIFVVSFNSFNVFWISCSVSISSADVESSKIRIGAFFAMARAILIRCFCPPESPTPRSPMTVAYCSSIFSMKSFACAQSAALRISSNGITFRCPILIFSSIVSENRNTSCNTTEILLRSCFKESFRTSVPSTFTTPSVTS